MKVLIPFIFLLSFMYAFETEKSAPDDGGYFDVYLVNDCSHEIDVRLRTGGGSSTTFDLDPGEKEKRPMKEGYEVYVDGKKVYEADEDDKGDEIVICD